jgi:ribose 5-phosphate isomerase B
LAFSILREMRVAVAFDHAGFPLKKVVVPLLEKEGHEVVDCGTDSEESADYPVHAARAARLVSEGDVDRAVVACGTGSGVAIVANKFPGVRAVNARHHHDAKLGRLHNDANVLALGARRLSQGRARRLVELFLRTEFEGGRHQRRVDQIGAIETGQLPEADNVEHASST